MEKKKSKEKKRVASALAGEPGQGGGVEKSLSMNLMAPSLKVFGQYLRLDLFWFVLVVWLQTKSEKITLREVLNPPAGISSKVVEVRCYLI